MRHSTGGPSFGQALSKPFSSVVQSPFGPAHCGQSAGSAATTAETPIRHASSEVVYFIRFIPLWFRADAVNGLVAADDDDVLVEERRADDGVVERVDAERLVFATGFEHGGVAGVVE